MKINTLIIRTAPSVLEQLIDDYSDTGYTNSNGGDIIIDTSYLKGDPDQFDHFSGVTGLTKGKIEGAGYICFYS
jgi:hypothetical protein